MSIGMKIGPGALERTVKGGVWQESPLIGIDALLKSHHALASPVFHLREMPFLELVSLRGEITDPAFSDAVEALAGCGLPGRANTISRGSHYDLLWLGPDEWLARSRTLISATSAAPLETGLRERFQGLNASATDIGSGHTVLEIQGTKVRDVLARGCPLDLHASVFTLESCAQSYYFKSPVTLSLCAEDGFELVIRRSFADYFVKIMLDAAAPLLS